MLDFACSDAVANACCIIVDNMFCASPHCALFTTASCTMRCNCSIYAALHPAIAYDSVFKNTDKHLE